MIELDQLPNARRYFVHKRLLGAAKGFVTSGFNPLSAVGGFVAPTGPPVRRPAPRSQTARPTVTSAAEKEAGRAFKFGGATSILKRAFRRTPSGPSGPFARPLTAGLLCLPPFFRQADGSCKFDLDPGRGTGLPGGDQDVPVGQAVMGRYGAALTPGSKIVDRAVCLAGMQLGDDGFCYNRGSIRNSQRMWPRGRRPLLTGGDMRAISIASRAAARLTNTAVRLQEMGLIKKPVARKRLKKKN